MCSTASLVRLVFMKLVVWSTPFAQKSVQSSCAYIIITTKWGFKVKIYAWYDQKLTFADWPNPRIIYCTLKAEVRINISELFTNPISMIRCSRVQKLDGIILQKNSLNFMVQKIAQPNLCRGVWQHLVTVHILRTDHLSPLKIF